MSEKDGKTEKPTPKRLRDSRKKGDIAKSQELVSAASFAVFTLVFIPLWEFVANYSFKLLTSSFAKNFALDGFENNVAVIGFQSMIACLILIGPFLALGFLANFLASFVQVGFLFTGEAIKFDLKKLNPISGFKNIFSSQAIFGLIKNILKLIAIFYITYLEITGSLTDFINLSQVGVEHIFTFVLAFIKRLSIKLTLLLLVLGVADYVYNRYKFTKKLRMSKQEIKDEYKEQEGDPHVKSQRKALYHKMVGGVKNVKDATVVITNPTHLAIAIKYDRATDAAPMVIAKGADLMAQKIREEAKLYQIPIIENKPVARQLYKETGVLEPVPIAMYETIAEVLALVYRMNAESKHKI
ncbi:flagellar biosynthesis protein FlhB [Vagococcus penaei]|uniref:flagellar biosynthesis protein FlhB n=1 Tax=Vagococcus penaei TaxID=633807 RepID=UPI000F864E2E|nr:flagellar biosynthesis protein FlhB [Vagococcus penaei]RSU06713.1 flagellar biosynthesis protein FlhB [Vagococcus penaei]